MPRKIFVVIMLTVLYASGINAQVSEPIEADRPDQSESPSTTPKGYLQAEFGISAERANKENRSNTYPDFLIKYGLGKRIDLRLIGALVSEKNNSINLRGLQPIAIGFRTTLCEEKGIRPKTAFLGEIAIPHASSKNLRATYYAPAFRFAMVNDLSKKISLSYNLGAEWDGETPEPAFIYTLSFGFSLTEKLGAYAELYGFAPQLHAADHRADGGLTYTINNNVVFDVSGGIGISKNAPDHFLSAGFSFRVDTKGH